MTHASGDLPFFLSWMVLLLCWKGFGPDRVGFLSGKRRPIPPQPVEKAVTGTGTDDNDDDNDDKPRGTTTTTDAPSSPARIATVLTGALPKNDDDEEDIDADHSNSEHPSDTGSELPEPEQSPPSTQQLENKISSSLLQMAALWKKLSWPWTDPLALIVSLHQLPNKSKSK